MQNDIVQKPNAPSAQPSPVAAPPPSVQPKSDVSQVMPVANPPAEEIAVVSQPVVESPQSAQTPPPSQTAQEKIQPAELNESDAKQKASQLLAAQPQTKTGPHAPVRIIVTAVVICVIMIGLAVYVGSLSS